MTPLYGIGLGIGTQNRDSHWLEVFYPQPLYHPANKTSQAFINVFSDYTGGNQSLPIGRAQLDALYRSLRDLGPSSLLDCVVSLKSSKRPLVVVFLKSDEPASSVPEAYFKLHLLSHRLVKPHGTNLSGLFSLLPSVAWTNLGAIDLSELAEKQLQARLAGSLLNVESIDKFPKMSNYIVPPGVRIAHTARVRLGAHIGQGTTIMHEGFVNFNAGSLGESMIEGRVSAGVVVGRGSDLGGGCSTMGTLSGGGDMVISIGEQCLIGANSGIGIPLGDRCTIESGLYVTAGTKVNLLNEQGQSIGCVKARELAGQSDLLFRRNSMTGQVECLSHPTSVGLNEELHENN